MPRLYLRYRLGETFGVVVSPAGGLVLLRGSLAACGALEAVCVWDTRTGEPVRRLVDPSAASDPHISLPEVTALARSPDCSHVAAG